MRTVTFIHNKMTCCDTATINGNAIFEALPGASYRFINISGADIKLVPNGIILNYYFN